MVSDGATFIAGRHPAKRMTVARNKKYPPETQAGIVMMQRFYFFL